MTNKQLQALCNKWQRVLRLQQWKVTVRFARMAEMEDLCKVGDITFNQPNRRAQIKLMAPGDWDDSISVAGYCIEQTLVHELLHLHFAPFQGDDDSEELRAQELAINMIASALVSLNSK